MAEQVEWQVAWGKSLYEEGLGVTGWLPLYRHLDDSAAVAGRLIDRWVPRQIIARIGEDLPDGPAGTRILAVWLAGVHDVGKISPAFAVQVPLLADRMREHGLAASPRLKDDPLRRRVTHSLVGHCAVRDWLTDELGFARQREANQWAVVVGSHHGVPPEDVQIRDVRGRPDLAGAGRWERARRSVLERATAAVGGRAVLERYRGVNLSRPSQVLLTAIVILADWIASNDDLFPLWPISTADEPVIDLDEQNVKKETERRLEDGWSRLNLPNRWEACPPGDDVDQAFRDRFGGPPDRTARPIQRATVEAAKAQAEAGLLIVEAPMGSGKTEAALLAAEVLAARSGAGGCFVALPTQATTDAMFSRVNRWLEKLPRSADVTVTLAHGKATLNDEYTGLVSMGRSVCVGMDEPDVDSEVIAHRWLRGRKKGPLASFVVGTIDQALFAGLKSRHLMLRHLALAGKVVIIDEVHAYDVYMSQYLHRVLHWLGAYRVPVVLLSATLPPRRRGELLRAYDSGRGRETSLEPGTDPGYPVVVSSEQPPRTVTASVDTVPVRLDHLTDDLETLVSYLREHLSDGGCAVVVRNTVTRVQETADRLETEFGADHVTVNHSRFLACDRADTDRGLLERFGPSRTDVARPLHIVVASQVVEQSLDVDFDLMVTDLAPTDLILQRLGRLHRHQRTRPERLTQARCGLVGVINWHGVPVEAVRHSRRIYGDHTLLRAAALLGPQERDTVTLPEDIPSLVQLAYDDRPIGPAEWQPAMNDAHRRAQEQADRRTTQAQKFLLGESTDPGTLIGWIWAGVGEADDKASGLAQVRDGEESLEVLVVQRDADSGLLTPEWISSEGGRPVPVDLAIPARQARTIAACSLRLPLALCHEGVINDVIAALEANHFASFHQSPLLKGQLVLVLDSDRTAAVRHGNADFRLTYDPSRGLIHERHQSANS